VTYDRFTKLDLHPDRYFSAEGDVWDIAWVLRGEIATQLGPHRHTDPRWFAT